MKQPTFQMKGRIFPYINLQGFGDIAGEMSVVIPIALHFYSQVRAKKMFNDGNVSVLEIGHVLPQVLPKWEAVHAANKRLSVYPHQVISPIMKAEGVAKEKLISGDPFQTSKKYDLILCLENMGRYIDLETEGKDSEGRVKAFQELIMKWQGWLKKDGLIMIPVPAELTSIYGGRSWVDKYLDNIPGVSRSLRIPDKPLINLERQPYHPDHVWKMNRLGMGIAGNVWKEVNPELDPDISYYRDVPSAGSIYFLFWGQLWQNWI